MRALPVGLVWVLLWGPPSAWLCAEDAGAGLGEMLVLESLASGGRSLFQTDPLEAARVRGDLAPPVAGAEVRAPDGRRARWERIAVGADGTFAAHPAFRGGWGYLRVDSPKAQVRLLRASGPARLYWNGEPRVGDGYGSLPVLLPLRLRAGENHLWLRFGRGVPRLAWADPPAPLFLTDHDATLPDVRPEMLAGGDAPGGEPAPCWIGVLAVNASGEHPDALHLVSEVEGADPVTHEGLPAPPPHGVHKVALRLRLPARAAGPTLRVTVRGPGAAPPLVLTLSVASPGATHRRTFRSRVDGSVQSYAVTPAQPGPGATELPGLVLSLHGAGVAALGQARAYAPKPDLHVVAPTNRRPFGFDWEVWGREDAFEALADARATLAHDPARLYLTGHSMGGHGTWMIGAQSPGTFAAIAPSAGWRDFWSYGGAPAPSPDDPVLALFDRASNPSRHELWEANLAHVGVYVLHGDADDNVPVSEAREMRRRLAAFHRDFAYFEQPGAGHWWGNACVDWPPLFEFFRWRRRPAPDAPPPPEFAFVTVDPRLLAGLHGVEVLGQQQPLLPSRVTVRRPAAAGQPVRVTTSNVRALGLAPGALRAEETLEIDGEALGAGADLPRCFERTAAGRWAPTSARPRPPPVGFQAVFDHGVALVYGTGGTEAERAWALAKARFDAETFWYRGNGALEVLSDRQVLAHPARLGTRPLVLYGTPATNAAFGRLGRAPALGVAPGGVTVAGRLLSGEDLAVFELLRRDDAPGGAPWAAVAATGAAGRRLLDALPLFVSGIRLPDWCVLGGALADHGAPGARAAGFWDAHGRAGEDAAVR